MEEKGYNGHYAILGLVIFGFVLMFSLWVLQDTSCDDCFELDGYLSAIKPSGHIVVDGQDYYISDWFSPNGNMPIYVNDYVGHNVHIDYVAGCGRRMITDIKKI